MKKNNKKIIDNKKGFTLVEILVSLAILFLIITGVVIFSVQTIEAHTKSKAMQNAIENARFGIEGLSKRIRTSHDVGGGGNSLTIVDNNVGNTRYSYSFSNDRLTMNGRDLVGGGNVTVSGNFSLQDTIADSGVNNRRGFVRISMTIDYNDGGNLTEKDSMTIQSTVSLRDYGEDE